MIRICLLVLLVAAVVVLGPRFHDRLQKLTLVDSGANAVHDGVWEILGAFAWWTGVLAAVVLVVALIVGFTAADIYGRVVIERLRDRLQPQLRATTSSTPPGTGAGSLRSGSPPRGCA